MSEAHSEGQSTLIRQMLEKETGRRKPSGIPHAVLFIIPILWSLFQVWYTSPLPFALGIGVFNDTAARSLHLGFSIFIAYLGFPMLKGSPKDRIPLYDWVMAAIAGFCAAYLYIFQDALAARPGIPTQEDIIVACVGIVLLLEATRRVMGLPMTCVAIVFILYVFAGPFAPDLIAHRGASLSRAASQFWLTQEGVFGVPLGVSTSFVFLYVLFGAMLENAGAGNYLTSLSFALLGHLRGGPAKAAVVASGLHGLISGSSIANVLTCGPVTIMLMKKVGFSAEKAGAVEVAAGSNGQIMPPVMGAAAFLMVEYINMPYAQLIKHAFIPALLTYGSLLYIVHLEACKMDMVGLPRQSTLKHRLIGWGLTLSALTLLIGAIHYLTAWIPALFGGYAWIVFALLLLIGYSALVALSLRYPELPEGDEQLMHLPAVKPILLSGLHFLLPIAALVWCLMVMEMSPGLAAFYACSCMAFILLTQKPLTAILRKEPVFPAFMEGLSRLLNSMVAGGKNMVGIGLATASAGIIVGAVSLTGVGQVLASVVEALSMGYLPLVLIMTAILALILGMGLPTTANYIIVSTLLAPVIYNLAAAHGLAIPLVAVHLFCLYFGIMADATPPVALAAFAAAGISGGDPFKTGIQGFYYEMRTAILPFVFLYNPEILLIGIESTGQLIWVLLTAVLACMAFACATQAFMLTRARWWEVVLLLAAMIVLFRPDLPQNALYPPYQTLPPAELMQTVESLKKGDSLRLFVSTDFGEGRIKKQVLALPVEGEGAEQKLENAGLVLAWEGDKLMVNDVLVDSRVEKLGLNMDDPTEVLGLEVPSERPDKGLFSIPGLILLGLVVLTQLRRKRREDGFKLNKSDIFA